jgi:hypothetical protein
MTNSCRGGADDDTRRRGPILRVLYVHISTVVLRLFVTMLSTIPQWRRVSQCWSNGVRISLFAVVKLTRRCAALESPLRTTYNGTARTKNGHD